MKSAHKMASAANENAKRREKRDISPPFRSNGSKQESRTAVANAESHEGNARSGCNCGSQEAIAFRFAAGPRLAQTATVIIIP